MDTQINGARQQGEHALNVLEFSTILETLGMQRQFVKTLFENMTQW